MMQDMGKTSSVCDLPMIHDYKLICDFRDRAEIMCDKDHCRVMFLFDPHKLFQDLILGDRIDRRCRLVRDQKRRL